MESIDIGLAGHGRVEAASVTPLIQGYKAADLFVNMSIRFAAMFWAAREFAMPSGIVFANERKEEFLSLPIPHVTVLGCRGSALAASAIHALRVLITESKGSR